MTHRGAVRSGAVLGLALAVALGAAGCAQRQGPPPQLAVTTTTERGATTTTLPGGPPPLAPLSLAQIRGELDAAVAGHDFCKLAAALDDAAPDTTDGATVTATYEALARAVHAGSGFVPAELSDPWKSVVTGVDEGVEASQRVGGDVKDPTLRAPFLDGQFESAMSAVERWHDTHC
jgi:hypothetical protein